MNSRFLSEHSKILFRDYVINNLPQLTELDGQKIEKSERLKAAQQKEKAEKSILDERNVLLSFTQRFTAVIVNLETKLSWKHGA